MTGRDTDLAFKEAFSDFPRDFSPPQNSQGLSLFSLALAVGFPITNCARRKVMISERGRCSGAEGGVGMGLGRGVFERPSHLARVGCLAHKQAKMVRRGPEPDQQQEHLETSLGKEVLVQIVMYLDVQRV